MSDYESIRGTRVKYLSSDPTLDSSTEGQVWYNSTSGTNKALVQIKAWSSGGNMATARRESGAAGTQTASVVFGGALPPGNNDVASTEEYNGFSYSTGGDMTSAREGMGAAGTQTAALAFGGANYGTPEGTSDKCEEYDGSSWTAKNTMNNE